MEKTAESITSFPVKPALPGYFAPESWAKKSAKQRASAAALRRIVLFQHVQSAMLAANKSAPGAFSGNAILVLAALHEHDNLACECFPGYLALGVMVGLKERTVQAAVRELEGHGLIERQKKASSRGNHGYSYTFPLMAYDGPALGGEAEGQGVSNQQNLPVSDSEVGGGEGSNPQNLPVSGVANPQEIPVSGSNQQNLPANLTKQDSYINQPSYLDPDRTDGLSDKGLQVGAMETLEGKSLSAEQVAGQGSKAGSKANKPGKQASQASKGGVDQEAEIVRLGKLAQKAACAPYRWKTINSVPAVRAAVQARGLEAVQAVVEGLLPESMPAYEIQKLMDAAVVPGEAPSAAPVAAVAAIAPLEEGAGVNEVKARDVLVEIKARIGAGKFSKWFAKVNVVVTDKQIKLYCGQGYVKDWIAGDLANSVTSAVHAAGLGGREVQYLTGNGAGVSPTVVSEAPAAVPKPAPEPSPAAPVVEVKVAEARAAACAADESAERIKKCGQEVECSEDETLWDEALSSISEAPKAVKTLRIIGRRGMTVVLQASSVQHQRAVEAAFADIITDAWTGVLGDRPWIRVLAPGDEVDLAAA